MAGPAPGTGSSGANSPPRVRSAGARTRTLAVFGLSACVLTAGIS
jgi:hypothetical protein